MSLWDLLLGFEEYQKGDPDYKRIMSCGKKPGMPAGSQDFRKIKTYSS
jgi:hypothetical protein